jgi:hypothetical protein
MIFSFTDFICIDIGYAVEPAVLEADSFFIFDKKL